MINIFTKYRFWCIYIVVTFMATSILIYSSSFANKTTTTENKSVSSSQVMPTKMPIIYSVLNELNENYQLYAQYPKTETSQIDLAMKQEVDKLVNDFKAKVALKTAGQSIYKLRLTAKVNYSDDYAINFEYIGEETVADITSTYQRNYLYNKKTGAAYSIKDLISEAEYPIFRKQTLELSSAILAKYFDQNLFDTALSANFVDNNTAFEILDNKTINLVFDSGQIANKDLGIVRIAVTSTERVPFNKNLVDTIFLGFLSKNASSTKPTATPANDGVAATVSNNVVATPTVSDASPQPLIIDKKTNCNVQKCIALTFDDGPSEDTKAILDLLKQYNARATFFMVGAQVVSHSDMVKRVYEEGHEIGNHTWSHANMTELTDTELIEQISNTNKAISDVIGKKPVLVRPPYGKFKNANQMQIVNSPFILWYGGCIDWSSQNPDAIHNQTMITAKPGAIILAHDTYSTTVEAYKRIIPDLQKQGYQLVTVSELLDFSPGNTPIRSYRQQY